MIYVELLRNSNQRLDLGQTLEIVIVYLFFYVRHGCESGCVGCTIDDERFVLGYGSEVVEGSDISRAAIRKSLFQSSSRTLDIEM